MLKTGTMVDATIIAAASSTKNTDGQRDPEMHQTKKGNCRIPCDHVTARSWALFNAREILREVIRTVKAE
jgi:hypothetical protein